MLVLLAALFSGAARALPACASDADCSFNGQCDTASGVCACDAPWVSDVDGAGTLPACGFLSFKPSPVSACGPACAFHGGPSSLDTAWTSWGMSVALLNGSFHGFVAEMANGCGLSAWTKGSQVVHATADAPAGPYTRVAGGLAVPPWSHNPQHITASDGTHVIFTLGDGWAQNGAPENCTKRGGGGGGGGAAAAAAPFMEPLSAGARGLGNCTPLAAPANCNPNPCWACNITLHTSADIDAPGPWAPFATQIIGLSNFDNIQNWNPSPLVLPNGSIAVMIHTDDNQGWSGESIAVADTWRGPYHVTVGNEAIANQPKSQEECVAARRQRSFCAAPPLILLPSTPSHTPPSLQPFHVDRRARPLSRALPQNV